MREIPFIATPTMAKLIKSRLGKPGSVIEMKYDNRFKDGNFKIVKGVVRGNKNTLELKRFTSGGYNGL
jgi:hypothetical protein